MQWLLLVVFCVIVAMVVGPYLFLRVYWKTRPCIVRVEMENSDALHGLEKGYIPAMCMDGFHRLITRFKDGRVVQRIEYLKLRRGKDFRYFHRAVTMKPGVTSCRAQWWRWWT